MAVVFGGFCCCFCFCCCYFFCFFCFWLFSIVLLYCEVFSMSVNITYTKIRSFIFYFLSRECYLSFLISGIKFPAIAKIKFLSLSGHLWCNLLIAIGYSQ